MANYAEIKLFVQKCRNSCSYFIESCCKIKHPTLGVIPFKLFKYQKDSLREFRTHRFNIFRKCRQSGISTLTGVYALWLGLFFPHKTVLIVSKRDDDAKKFLDRNVKLPYKYLPAWMHEIWGKPDPRSMIWNEHEVGFSNGSTITSLTSSPDTLRSNASSLNIIDEAAFMPDMETMWSGGWSCVTLDSLISSDGQLTEIGSLGNIDGPQWQDLDIDVQSDTGTKHSDKFYINGIAPVNKITTSLGYEITCTDNHRLKDENYDWIYSRDIRPGQSLSLKAGSQDIPTWRVYLRHYELTQQPLIEDHKNSDIISAKCSYFNKPSILDEQLAELIGYYIGDGWLSTDRLKLSYDPQDEDLYSHFAAYLKSLHLEPHHANGAKELRIDNAHLVEWWRLNKFNSKTCAADAEVPELILKSPKNIRAAFLRGLFEAYGWNYSCRQSHGPNSRQYHLGLSSVSEKLCKQVQLILLDLGIISKRLESKGGYENSGLSWRLELPNLDEIIKFMNVVGFISNRKNVAITKQTTYRPSKYSIGANGIFHDTVASIKRKREMTVDISVPSNNTYIANGFISHNTMQHGGCLAPSSLVLDIDDGLKPIKNYHTGNSTWEDINSSVATDGPAQKAYASYHNGNAETRQITTVDGHYIEATLNHKFRVIDNGEYKWAKCSDLKCGDRLILSSKEVDTGHNVELDQDIFSVFDNGCKLCGNDYDATQLNKLSKEDNGLCPSCLTTSRMVANKITNLPQQITPNIARFIGCLIGDGFYDKYGRFSISCDRQYNDYIDWLHEVIRSEFRSTPKNEISPTDWSVRFNNKALALLFSKNKIIKQPCSELTVPEVILKSPNSIKAQFLSGLFEAGGCVSGNYVSMSTDSRLLAGQVQNILLMLGIRSKVSPRKRKNGFSENIQYNLSLKTRNDIIKFRDKIGFISSQKCAKLNKIKVTNRSHNDRYTDARSMHQFYEASKGLSNAIRQGILHHIKKGSISRQFVKNTASEHAQLKNTTLGQLACNDLFENSIETIHHSACDTYDISVSNTHCYIANGFVSHNSVIVISTPQGVGNWYWDKWTDAENSGLFNPIRIHWWDMDWVIEADDPISGEHIKIAPTYKIRKCTTREEIDKYGPYWSPWLEQEYKGLQARGESHLFRQEILSEFIGSGGTVLTAAALHQVNESVENAPQTMAIEEPIPWINQANGDREYLDFNGSESKEGLWIWSPPVPGKEAKYQNGRMVDVGETGHSYVIGVDIATGENNDYSAIQVFDINTMEQAAEYMGRVQIPQLAKMVDWIGRWYNNALVNPERTGIGAAFIQDLQALLYPNIWRQKKQKTLRPGSKAPSAGINFAPYGFATSPASKPTLNKSLVQYISEEPGEGYSIYSSRLLKQLQIYIRHRNKQGIETKRTGAQEGRGNHDDLVIAAALSFVAAPDAVDLDPMGLLPTHSKQSKPKPLRIANKEIADNNNVEYQKEAMDTRDPHVIVPITFNQINKGSQTQKEALDEFARQLINTPSEMPVTKPPKPKLSR